jgi:hypothetical protein
LGRLVKKAGLREVYSWADPDLDNLFHRIPAISFLPGGRLAARLARLFPGDSRIICLQKASS